MRPNQKTLWCLGVSLIILLLIALAFSRPVRLRYHKWRLVAAKQEHLRLARGEYRFSDKARELLLGRSLTWGEVDATWKHHEDALVQLGFLTRVEYYAGRGSVPPMSDPDFASVIAKMDAACPFWSYRGSTSGDSLTVTATKESLELLKKLAPAIGLQQNKPVKDDRRCGGKGRRHSRSCQPLDNPVSVEWAALFGFSGQAAPGTHFSPRFVLAPSRKTMEVPPREK